MRTTLLFTILLLLTACNDGTSTQTSTDVKENAPVQKEPLVTKEPVEPEPSTEETVTKTETAETPEIVETTKAVEAVEPAVSKESSAAEQESAKKPAPVSGYAIFAHKCASCHGKQGEKAALNTSKIIAGWEKEKSLAALEGYKAGSYGGNLKAIMKGQINTMSDEELKAVAEYISTL